MALLQHKPRFTFSSHSGQADDDTFAVVAFTGTEGLSQCYEFDIELASEKKNLDLDEILANPARFSILRDAGETPFHGILTEFEQLHEFGPYAFFRTRMVPRLWWSQFTFFNQIFLDKTVPEILTDVLKDAGLAQNTDFELRLQNGFPASWEFVCQYQESHSNFLNRWMEHEGYYYFFDQASAREKLVITDTLVAHHALPEGNQLIYSPPSGLDHAHRSEVIHRFGCTQSLTPNKLKIKDYNYRKPSLAIEGEAKVHPKGLGEYFLYNEHSRSVDEAKRLAKIRAEEQLCRRQRFTGESAAPYVRSGFVFQLSEHYRNEFNQHYLVTLVRHEGAQVGYLIAGLQQSLPDRNKEVFYKNLFEAIPNNVQFRPPRQTPKPQISGTINARIDAYGSGKYAELDDQGRYKVKFYFDASDASDGKASAWLRMAQPYAGTNSGMHFPLLKGTEVLVGFVDGDPDRPLILAAAPNPDTPSVVDSSNSTKNCITTSGQNKIHMNDKESNENIVLHSEKQETWVRLGAPNDPPPPSGSTGAGDSAESGYLLSTKGNIGVYGLGNYDVNIGGLQTTKIFLSALYNQLNTGQKTGIVLGRNSGVNIWKMEANATKSDKYEGKRFWAGATRTLLWAKKSWAEGEQTGATGEKSVAVGSQTDATGTQTSAAGTQTEAQGTKTVATGAQTEAQGTKTVSAGTQTEAKGTEVKSAGVQTESTGAKTVSVGVQQDNLGAQQTNTGATQKNQGSEIKTAAGVAMKTSGGAWILT
jgi:type VI secretion system secreted protein VgrG